MEQVGIRELRNTTKQLIDHVAEGYEIVITVNGVPRAKLVPLSGKPRFVSRERFLELFEGNLADPGLRKDLEDMLGGETTDDLRDPWS